MLYKASFITSAYVNYVGVDTIFTCGNANYKGRYVISCLRQLFNAVINCLESRSCRLSNFLLCFFNYVLPTRKALKIKGKPYKSRDYRHFITRIITQKSSQICIKMEQKVVVPAKKWWQNWWLKSTKNREVNVTEIAG